MSRRFKVLESTGSGGTLHELVAPMDRCIGGSAKELADPTARATSATDADRRRDETEAHRRRNLTDERRSKATLPMATNAAIACAKCERKIASPPCFDLEHAAKACGSSTTDANAALKCFKREASAMIDKGCMLGAEFRKAVFRTTLQPVWGASAGKKTSLAETLLNSELRAAAIPLGVYDKERLIEEIDNWIAIALLREDSRSLYDPRKGASLKTYIRRIVNLRIGPKLRQIAKVTQVEITEAKSRGSKRGDGLVTPPELCVKGVAESDVEERQRTRQVGEAHYHLLKARVCEERIGALIKGQLIRKSKEMGSPQHAKALLRTARVIPDIAGWHPQMVCLQELQVEPRTLSLPLRLFIQQEVVTALGYSNGNGTELERLICRHSVDALHDLLSARDPDELRLLLDQAQAFRERARHLLTTYVDAKVWTDFLNNAAARARLRDIPADAPARLLHMIPWADIDAQARGHPPSIYQNRPSLAIEQIKPGDLL